MENNNIVEQELDLELSEKELELVLNELEKDDYPRTFVINTRFSDELDSQFMEWFLNLPDLNDEHPEPIHIHISSEGGAAATLFKMLDMLGRFKGEIHGFANGICASAGLYLLCACDRRDVGKYTDLLYHTCQYTSPEQLNIRGHMDVAKDIKKLNNKLEKMIKENTKITNDWLKKYRYKDYWFDKDIAINLGIHNAEEYDELMN